MFYRKFGFESIVSYCSAPIAAASRALRWRFISPTDQFHAIYAVNLPDLEVAVEPHWSSDRLLATLPASLLSMRQGLWRLNT